jgi:hypothetical protein
MATNRQTADHLMPDLSDVEEALAALVSQALYPSGVDNGSAVGVVCRIYRGWPSSTALNADLQAGRVNVTVVPDTESGTTTTRYATRWQTQPMAPSFAAAVHANEVAFSGNPTQGHMIGLLVAGKSYVYLPVAGDTPELVAASLAASIRQDRPVQLSGRRITLPGGEAVVARVAVCGTAYSDVRRQQRDLRIIFWCPDPIVRDQTVSAVDHALARQAFVQLPGGSEARLGYSGTAVYDQAQNALLYRRDLIYTVEYPTIIEDSLPAMLFGDLLLNAAEFTA